MSSVQDKILYSRLKKKDRKAFVRIYDSHLNDIYRFIYFKVSSKEIAEDLTSSVFLKTWDYIQNEQLKDYKTLKSLLYVVARNLVIDHYRKKSQKLDVSYDNEKSPIQIIDEKQDMAEQVDVKLDLKLVEAGLSKLKDEYKEVIMLRYINELSISEIAEVLGKSKGSVRVLAHRALSTLKSLVDKT